VRASTPSLAHSRILFETRFEFLDHLRNLLGRDVVSAGGLTARRIALAERRESVEISERDVDHERGDRQRTGDDRRRQRARA
jgi:hypothetical protein